MSGRIWPGALCYLTRCLNDENNGRVVTAVRFCPGEKWTFPDGIRTMDGWAIDRPIEAFGGRFVTLVPEFNLAPITPPPSADTTEDRSPCEVESA